MKEENTIKLTDGTELTTLEPVEKEALEKEIAAVLDKYNAKYLPVIKKVETLQEITQTAGLFLLKIKGIPTPFVANGDNNGKTEEAPETN